jgi:hypothetical protein
MCYSKEITLNVSVESHAVYHFHFSTDFVLRDLGLIAFTPDCNRDQMVMDLPLVTSALFFIANYLVKIFAISLKINCEKCVCIDCSRQAQTWLFYKSKWIFLVYWYSQQHVTLYICSSILALTP